MTSSNPFAILGIAPEADDAAIRAAYHKALSAGAGAESPGADRSVISEAYALIRTQTDRDRWRFTSVHGFIADPPSGSAQPLMLPPEELDRLICELAFASDWELGEITT